MNLANYIKIALKTLLGNKALVRHHKNLIFKLTFGD